MASLLLSAKPLTFIDYTVTDGRVRSFTLRGSLLYDEDAGIVKPGWHRQLVRLVLRHRLDRPDSRGAYYAFIITLQMAGLIPEYHENP